MLPGNYLSLLGEAMKRRDEKSLKDELAKNHACYVLITCDQLSENGEMQVEMSYQGDATLAAYILQGAQLRLDEKQSEEGCSSDCSKIHYF
jgi:hypothetical protein